VYNTPDLVDAATRERVTAAAAELGFVPDRHASALRRKTSTTLLLVEIEGQEAYRWPGQRAYQSLYGEIIRGLVHHLQTTPWHLQLVTLPSLETLVPLLTGIDFAGILGFDVTAQNVADALASLGRPVVCAHHGDHLTGVSTVTTDNVAGGRLQAQWMTDRGLKRVAYVTGLSGQVRSHQLRREGFYQVLSPQFVLESAVGLVEGRAAAQELAALVRAQRVQGIACVNDLTALGVIQGLALHGVRVPTHVVVVGYDNLAVTDLLEAALPSVEARLPQVYERALDVLIAQVRRPGQEVHESLPPRWASDPEEPANR
jgi:DNA-binding LacI/PurR family transcriptional regulator